MTIDTYVTEWIASVKAWIDKYTGKTFEAAVASTKYYDGNGTDRIFVDSFIGTPTEVSILDGEGNVAQTLVDGTDYRAYPLNSTDKDQIVFFGPTDSWPGVYPNGNYKLKVTADFWVSTTVPADIELVATKLVGSIAKQRSASGGGVVESEKLGDYAVKYNFQAVDDAATALGVFSILDGWREPTL